MSNISTEKLDKQVQTYKTATSNQIKEQAFQTILEILTNHIRAIKMYLLGYEDYKVSKQVSNYMLSNMKSTSSVKNTDEFLSILQQNVKMQGYEEDDACQTIYCEIIKLIQSYKYTQLSFLQYVTYLLPRRIQDKFWKHSKDQMNQMNTMRDSAEEQEFDDYIYGQFDVQDNTMHQSILTDYDKLRIRHGEELQHQILKYKK